MREFSILALLMTSLTITACGGNGGSSPSKTFTPPAGLPTSLEMQGVDLNSVSDERIPSRLTQITAHHENNGVYALSGSEFSYEGRQFKPSGVYYNGELAMFSTSSDLDYSFSGVQGDILGDTTSTPLDSDAVFHGVYSETNWDSGTHNSGDATITVSGTSQTMVVDGPSALSGVTMTWDAEQGSYFYNPNEMSVFGDIDVSENEVGVTYASPNVSGIAFGTR